MSKHEDKCAGSPRHASTCPWTGTTTCAGFASIIHGNPRRGPACDTIRGRCADRRALPMTGRQNSTATAATMEVPGQAAAVAEEKPKEAEPAPVQEAPAPRAPAVGEKRALSLPTSVEEKSESKVQHPRHASTARLYAKFSWPDSFYDPDLESQPHALPALGFPPHHLHQNTSKARCEFLCGGIKAHTTPQTQRVS